MGIKQGKLSGLSPLFEMLANQISKSVEAFEKLCFKND